MRNAIMKTVIGPPENSPDLATLGRSELDQLFSATYEELRRMAVRVRRGDPSATLTPTVLVNEAWLKLARSPGFAVSSELHFKRIAARAMRQLLVEAARRRLADKRGGAAAHVTVSFALDTDAAPAGEEELLKLDAALEALGQVNARQAAMVEGRFFGGLDIPAIASLLDISEATVLRDWRVARAWLAREMCSG
jgi:RNA polymerase sigma factor (TIGR02999 family)